jgi:hypothetical protein
VSPDAQRFWAKVDRSGECWLWLGSKTTKGYGNLRHNGSHVYAHRYALILAGRDPGESVDHICHVKHCVRPDHLRSATNKQNSENLTGSYANSKSGIRGVWWDKRANGWVGTVGHNGRQHRKRFATVEEAAEFVRLKRLELFTHNDLDRVG